MTTRPEDLVEILGRARSLGFLGPGPVEVHVDHARGYATVASRALGRTPSEFCDLGSGGGVPALVLASVWPDASAVLVESKARRAAFLRDAVSALGGGGRIEVVESRGEDVAHDPSWRERFGLVTARGFGPPPMTAEIASGLLRIGGMLVVSEPPEPDPTRWPTDRLQTIGLGAATVHAVAEAHFAVLRKTTAAPAGIPRSSGRPGKRPLW